MELDGRWVSFPNRWFSGSTCQFSGGKSFKINMPKFANFSRSQLPSCPAAQLLIKMLIFQGVVSYFFWITRIPCPRMEVAIDVPLQIPTGKQKQVAIWSRLWWELWFVNQAGNVGFLTLDLSKITSIKVDQDSRPPLQGRPRPRTSPTRSVWKLLVILKMEDECFFFFWCWEDSKSFIIFFCEDCDPSK